MTDSIDINSPELQNAEVQVDDISGEKYFAAPVPEDGDHAARLALGQDGIKAGRQKEEKGGAYFLTAHLAIQLFNETGEKAGMVFDRPNSIILEREGKKSSRLHAVLDILGEPAPLSTTIGDLASHSQKVLSQNLACVVGTQWQASSKAQTSEEVSSAIAAGYIKGKKKDTFKVGDYYTFLKGQKSFPELEDGKHDPEVANPITGETVRAQAVVTRYKRASASEGVGA